MGETAAETPVMAQFAEAKRRFPDALLFFRMGDFYETFHEDAKVASGALGLTLTARDRERKIPMAGVPVRSVQGYLRRLLSQGHKVAICEQITEPGAGRALLDRAVVRVLTPGTLTEDEALEPRASNFLLAVRPAAKADRKRRVGLAWVDLSTGRFLVAEVSEESWLDEAARIQPAEVVVPDDADSAATEDAAKKALRCAVSRVPPWTADPETAARALKEHFRVASLKAFGLERPGPSVGAAGAALEYLRTTQMTSLGHVTRIQRCDPAGVLGIERSTARRLELVQRADGSTDATVLSVLDRTATAMGGRMLREWLLSPLAEKAAIEHRQDGVEELVRDPALRRDLRESLRSVRDVERILARVATNRANARDLQALGRSLEVLPAVRSLLGSTYSGCLKALHERVASFDELAETLARAIEDDPPPVLNEGGMIRRGFRAELDELRDLSRNAKDWIAAYQAAESERTRIPNLKIVYHKVFGYTIEVTQAHREKVPADYVRKQTLANAERFVTPPLSAHEDEVLRSDERSKDLERRIFAELREAVAGRVAEVQATAAALAEADALASLAEVAAGSDWTRPEIAEDLSLEIRDGRHPVVEKHLEGGERFVPNDLALDGERRIALITGPNMAGKSTYIRQAALLVVLAQMGSFVPASKARIGLVDRLFTRVGAEDDLARGQSTFMVEMSEAAWILHHATERSLVVLDEVGRGTSTFDGIAIAWAITEYLSEVTRTRTLFATHYAELTELAQELGSVKNLNVAVREWGDSIVFLRRIQEGTADRSYGIHVARLAGVPEAVVERAKAVLASLEGEHDLATRRACFGDPRPDAPRDLQLGLFAPPPPNPAIEALKALDLERLTPLEALNRLAELKRLAADA